MPGLTRDYNDSDNEVTAPPLTGEATVPPLKRTGLNRQSNNLLQEAIDIATQQVSAKNTAPTVTGAPTGTPSTKGLVPVNLREQFNLQGPIKNRFAAGEQMGVSTLSTGPETIRAGYVNPYGEGFAERMQTGQKGLIKPESVRSGNAPGSNMKPFDVALRPGANPEEEARRIAAAGGPENVGTEALPPGWKRSQEGGGVEKVTRGPGGGLEGTTVEAIGTRGPQPMGLVRPESPGLRPTDEIAQQALRDIDQQIIDIRKNPANTDARGGLQYFAEKAISDLIDKKKDIANVQMTGSYGLQQHRETTAAAREQTAADKEAQRAIQRENIQERADYHKETAAVRRDQLEQMGKEFMLKYEEQKDAKEKDRMERFVRTFSYYETDPVNPGSKAVNPTLTYFNIGESGQKVPKGLEADVQNVMKQFEDYYQRGLEKGKGKDTPAERAKAKAAFRKKHLIFGAE